MRSEEYTIKIASIGREFPVKGVESFEYNSENTLLDFDLVLWDPSKLLYWYPHSEDYRGYPCLNSHGSVLIFDDRSRRMSEMTDLGKLGRALVIFIPAPKKFYIDTGQRTYSGSGRNQRTIIQVTEESLNSFIPISGDFNTLEASGTKIDFHGNDLLKNFWSANKGKLHFNAYFTHPIGSPFLFIQGTDKIVGSLIRSERGIILLLPHLMEEEEFSRKTDYNTAAKVFIESIVDLISALQKESGDFTLPEWTLDYYLPGEKLARDELQTLQDDLEKLHKNIDNKRRELARLERYRLLISAKGTALQNQVLEILREIGIEAREGRIGRDDIFLSFEGMNGVAEVKGTNKSAAEEHASQLEKWVSEYMTEYQIKTKGFLIVNAFCDIPLISRTGESFPNQMLKYSISREHCLITTTQSSWDFTINKINPG